MVTRTERRLILMLVRLGIFKVYIQMRLPCISARRGFEWLRRLIMRRQVVDNLKHAPCCPANHYHRQRFVFHPCICGTTVEMYAALKARATASPAPEERK